MVDATLARQHLLGALNNVALAVRALDFEAYNLGSESQIPEVRELQDIGRRLEELDERLKERE